ncbi:MAG: EscU/YscU/HrcU family type III secretion system export apparatus switch protein [Spirochaetia bacterium]|jgi:type III secretion system FlhB-like substrate exporter|nr:EscU/YscU/HrcU family type III secretion system export apparatus switch protein [Spirochaetia bacterium]
MPKHVSKRSVALLYDDTLPAPVIVAKGLGRVADRIDALAEASGVPIVRDEALVAGLEPIQVGDFVPPEYWELVARVLVFIRKVHV